MQPLTAALLECGSVAEVLQTVVERGLFVLGAQAGLAALVSPNGLDLEIVHISGYAEGPLRPWMRFAIAEPVPISDAVRSRAPLLLPDRDAWAARYPQLIDRIESGFQASVSLPLAARQRVYGAIHFSFRQTRVFGDGDQAFIGELARQGSLALERAVLFEELQNKRREAEQARQLAESSRAAAEAAQGRLSFLAEASALLSESLDYLSRLERLARLSVPRIADWATVDVLEADGSLVRLSVAHFDPERETIMREIQRRFPPNPSQSAGIRVVIRTGQPLIVPVITQEMLAQPGLDPEHRRLLQQVGMGGIISMPLRTQGRSLGAITFGMGGESPVGTGRVFDDEAITLARELADRASVAVDNARLFSAVALAKRQAEETLESISDMFYAVDADWRFTYINRRAAKIWQRDDLLGQNIWEMFPQSIGGVAHQALTKAMRERRAVTFETMSTVLDRWIEGAGYPAENGGISVYWRDIDERKRAEESLHQFAEALQHSETRYRRLLETALEGILIVSVDARIAYANRQMALMLGYDSAQELIGQSAFFLFHPEDAIVARQRWTARLQGVGEQVELRLRRKDGSTCWTIAHVSIERGIIDGEFVGTFTMFADITDKRHALDALQAKNDEIVRLLTELQDASTRQRRLLREMLASLTEGHLRLCDSAADLPAPFGASGDLFALGPTTARLVRQQVIDVARLLALSTEREQDLLTAAGEATMNAIVHAGGGEAQVRYDTALPGMQVWVTDQGPGIAEETIHRATLEKGYSSAGTLGHGFWLMLKTVDKIYLLTGPTGTTIVLEMYYEAPQPAWMQH